MESRIERLQRLVLKTKLRTLVIECYNLGNCSSAYDPNIYTPTADQKERKALKI